MDRRNCVAALAAALAPGLHLHAQTTPYPSRPVKIMVPYPAGSGPDSMARALAQQMQKLWGQSVVVDNRAGALGLIGTTEVARAAPDGYTLLLTTNTTQAANVALVRNLQYDPVKDFAPIARLAVGPMLLLVRADAPYATLADLVRAGQAPGPGLAVGYGSAASQVSAAKVAAAGKLNVVNVPYKGIPPAVTDLLGGQIAFTFADMAVALPLVRSGRARALGVTSIHRLPNEPQIPAIAETWPGFEIIGWIGLVAPAGTPQAALEKLDDVVQRALAQPEFVERLQSMHFLVAPQGPKPFADYIVTEIARWKQDAAAAGLQPE